MDELKQAAFPLIPFTAERFMACTEEDWKPRRTFNPPERQESSVDIVAKMRSVGQLRQLGDGVAWNAKEISGETEPLV